MKMVTVSSDYRVAIPASVKKSLGIRPGMKPLVAKHQRTIRLTPQRDIREYQGFLKGMNTAFERESDRI